MARFIETNVGGGSLTRRGALPRSARPSDDRTEPRRRVHLRGGEIADRQHKFICDCVIRDRSTRGARLRLPKNVSVPHEIWFYDHEFKVSLKAEVRWRGDLEIGIYIPPQPGNRK
jgi:hypothetical protein